jgi:peroxiredoxin
VKETKKMGGKEGKRRNRFIINNKGKGRRETKRHWHEKMEVKRKKEEMEKAIRTPGGGGGGEYF